MGFANLGVNYAVPALRKLGTRASGHDFGQARPARCYALGLQQRHNVDENLIMLMRPFDISQRPRMAEEILWNAVGHKDIVARSPCSVSQQGMVAVVAMFLFGVRGLRGGVSALAGGGVLWGHVCRATGTRDGRILEETCPIISTPTFRGDCAIIARALAL